MDIRARWGIRFYSSPWALPERIDATSGRRRLDVELVRRDLVESREQARSLVEAGAVTVGGSIALKASRLVLPGDAVEVIGLRPKYVSRGGLKLEAALDSFDLDVRGARAIDAGSSTGGFTDCLLQADAASVVAIDVGTHQLHERLRNDPRVELHEQTDIRAILPERVGGRAALVVADLSFISLRRVLSSLLGLVEVEGDVVVLLKPQFEAGRQQVSRGRGVISDPAVWREAIESTRTACDDAGAAIMDLITSPIRGGKTGKGNVEFLIHLRHRGSRAAAAELSTERLATMVDAAIDAVRTDR